MSYFNFPVKMYNYKNGDLRFVYDGELKTGDEVIVGVDKSGRDIKKLVDQILEERKSMGDFKDAEVPNSYRITVKEVS